MSVVIRISTILPQRTLTTDHPEIALLGIASIQGVKGTSIWLILIFPVLFTAGMCLLDTVDGALMMSLYTSTALANDRIAILYYSIILTLITVVVAMIIGFIQLLSLIANVSEPSGKFWQGVAVAGDHYDVIGKIRVALLGGGLRDLLIVQAEAYVDLSWCLGL